MKSAVYPMQDIIGSEKAASVDTTTDIERKEIVNGLLISHRAKGGEYVVADIMKPAGDIKHVVGEIVGYRDVTSNQCYFRPIKDFIAAMKKIPLNKVS